MHDFELYRVLLGLKDPWRVARVNMDVKQQQITVLVEYVRGSRFSCPSCHQEDCAVYDCSARTWRHLDTCQFQTLIQADQPRIQCDKCGVKTITVPWAEPMSRFTLLFERFAIDALLEMSLSGVCRVLRLSWDEADTIVRRAVKRGLQRRNLQGLKRIAIDEKAYRRGRKYITVVSDLEQSRVIWIGEDRTMATLDPFFESLGEKGRQGLECVCIDMWRPYVAACRKWLPDSHNKIVFDRFHVERQLNQAVDEVRQQENRELLRKHDRRLKKSKWMWFCLPENLPPARQIEFDELRKSDLRTARAWAMRQNLRRMWSCTSKEQAREHLAQWCEWANHTAMRPMKRMAELINRNLEGILNFITFRETSGRAEGINNKIQGIKKKAYGFRTVERLIHMIYFHCAKLHLYPYPH